MMEIRKMIRHNNTNQLRDLMNDTQNVPPALETRFMEYVQSRIKTRARRFRAGERETTMSKTLRENGNYRVKYWRWINEQSGEWYRTGLMTQESAEKVAESLRQSHEQVEVYTDKE